MFSAVRSLYSLTTFLDLGAAYGTAKSGVGISSMGVLKPELIFKSIVPIIMAGILGIYGLIVSVILSGKSKHFFIFNTSILVGDDYDYKSGYKHLASGLCCGLSSLVSPFFLKTYLRLLVSPSVL